MRRIIALVRLSSVVGLLIISTSSVGMTAEPAGGKFDGTWDMKGILSGGGSDRGGAPCGASLRRNATITNDKFSLLYNPRRSVYLTGTVDENGTLVVRGVRVDDANGTLKYDGHKFVGVLKAINCGYEVEMTKKE